MCICAGEPPDGTHKAAIWKEGVQVGCFLARPPSLHVSLGSTKVCIKLASRKNLRGGSGVLCRSCTCRGCPKVCPVHVLWDKQLLHFGIGAKPWASVSAAKALAWVRTVLVQLAVPCWIACFVGASVLCVTFQVPMATEYGTHAFRRGHARACSFFVYQILAPRAMSVVGSRRKGCFALTNLSRRPVEERGFHEVP